jgi:hypothetical protein
MLVLGTVAVSVAGVTACSSSSGSSARVPLLDTATVTIVPTSDSPPTTSPRHFGTLPVGATLPSDEDCAAAVRPAAEVRVRNTPFNMVRGEGPPTNPPPGPMFARVTGNFSGTTDEIIQWAACKWGIDEDIVRAQVAKESYWNQDAAGDFSRDPATCAPGHPLGENADHPNECAESVGLMQVRYPYWGWAFPDADRSSAYNIDVALAARRNCFEGDEAWVTDYPHGKDYAPGDIWGCVGMWFTGRWYTPESTEYIAAVQDYARQRIWTTPSFISFRG